MGENEQEARRVGLYLCQTLSDLPLRPLGEIFELRETAVCEATRRLKNRIATNPERADMVPRVKERITS